MQVTGSGVIGLPTHYLSSPVKQLEKRCCTTLTVHRKFQGIIESFTFNYQYHLIQTDSAQAVYKSQLSKAVCSHAVKTLASSALFVL